MSDNGVKIEAGFEADRIGSGFTGTAVMRWWFFISVPGALLRSEQARKGVADQGFIFARGGRCRDYREAKAHLKGARYQAEREIEFWRGQPSHALGADGSLIPLGELLPELTP